MTGIVARRLQCTLLIVASVIGASGGRAQGSPIPSPVQDPNCPDSSDTPATLGQYVGVAYRAVTSDPSRPLPPPCLLVAVAHSPSIPSPVLAQTLSLADAWLTLHAGDAVVLESKLLLLSKARRYAEVAAVFDQLLSADPRRATLNAYTVMIASAQRGADTSTMLRYLGIATTKFPTARLLAEEYEVLRQVPRLEALIDTVHRVMRADPQQLDAYPSLISIYGNLAQPDSAIAYTRIALRKGMSRNVLGRSLQSAVSSLLRTAQLQNAPDVWDATLSAASVLDSTLSTPETKYLVAISITEVALNRFSLLNLRQAVVPRDLRPEVCPSIPSLLALTDRATERLASGGDRASPDAVPAIRRQLSELRSTWLIPIHEICIAK